MTILDERARHAARELNSAVAEADLLLFESGIPALRQTPVVTHNRSRTFVFAGAFAAVLLFVGLTLAPGRMTAPTDPEGEAATRQPSPAADVVTVDGDPDARTPTTADGEGAPVTSIAVADLTPPAITVTSPENDAEYTADDFGGAAVPLVEFSGSAEPGSTVVARTGVDPEPTVAVGPDGLWSIELILQAGTNPVRFTAFDAAGNEQDATVTVTYTPETSATTTTTQPAVESPPKDDPSGEDRRETPDDAPSTVAFTAAATAGEASGNPATDVFSGTAATGSRVTLTSEYGDATAVAGADGTWSVTMAFRNAPLEQPFLVTAADDSGNRLKLEFVVRAG